MKALFILLTFALAGFAQDYEYGRPDDLKGLTRVYVATGSDIKNRDRIVKEIEKANVGLVVVDTFKEAQIFMRFRGEKETVVTGSTTRPADATVPIAITSVQTGDLVTGSGNVVVLGKEGRLRYVLDFEGEKKWGKTPATKFAQVFIKAYKKANGL